MLIKKIIAKEILDSRKQKTIQVIVITDKGEFVTSAPAGKSIGEYEVKSYGKGLEEDIDIMNGLNLDLINRLVSKHGEIVDSEEAFNFLKHFENLIGNIFGGNSLFVLEASLLKAMAGEYGKELWEFLIASSEFSNSENSKLTTFSSIDFPRPVGNSIGGGLHSKGKEGKKPDFQEFLFIPRSNRFSKNVFLNDVAYNVCQKYLPGLFKKRNDEGAWETRLSNEEVLDIMKKVQNYILRKYNEKVDIGVDIAASSFFRNPRYRYFNISKELTRNDQIDYISKVIKKYGLFYVEDPLEQNDFSGFAELGFEIKNKDCLIVGDDLTVTNPDRLEKAIRMKSINAIIVKPNQIGSLLKVKKVIEIAKKNNIKTIISHRSGETMDNTIADLAVGFQCDFIKCGIYGPVRRSKLRRLIEIERKVRRG